MRILAAVGLLVATAGRVQPWEEPTEEPVLFGLATYMDEGVMRGVIDYWRLPHSDGVALNAKGDKGREVMVIWLNDMTLDGPWPVVDCAKEHHYLTRVAQNRVLEVSARQAKAHGFYGVGPVPVIVLFEPFPKMLQNHMFN